MSTTEYDEIVNELYTLDETVRSLTERMRIAFDRGKVDRTQLFELLAMLHLSTSYVEVVHDALGDIGMVERARIEVEVTEWAKKERGER